MRNWLLTIVVILIFAGCGKEKDPEPAPFQAELISPASNEACTSTIIVSSTESKVQFKWKKAKHTENYELNIKNLLTGLLITHNVSDTVFEASLVRNTPYAWYVLSKTSKGPDAVKSSVWKFYNPGEASVSYTPFPAEILSPAMAQVIEFGSGKVTLDWDAEDIDNDIVSYDVYLGITKNPVLLSAGLTTSILNDVTITANKIYYWKVVTKDSKGNTSDSGLYEFKVN